MGILEWLKISTIPSDSNPLSFEELIYFKEYIEYDMKETSPAEKEEKNWPKTNFFFVYWMILYESIWRLEKTALAINKCKPRY